MSERIKIMYIDDEDLNLQLFAYNFSKKYEVLTGFSGYEGLELLLKNPDTKIVISDMKMPGMNGLEFIVRAKQQFTDKKYFILTGFDITDEIRNAINNNLIVKYLKKPFDIGEIDATIIKALS